MTWLTRRPQPCSSPWDASVEPLHQSGDSAANTYQAARRISLLDRHVESAEEVAIALVRDGSPWFHCSPPSRVRPLAGKPRRTVLSRVLSDTLQVLSDELEGPPTRPRQPPKEARRRAPPTGVPPGCNAPEPTTGSSGAVSRPPIR